MTIQILVTNIFIIFSVFITFSLGLFALIKSLKKGAAIAFFLLSISVDVFYISHFLGINATDQHAAYIAFMFNLANIFIVCFNYHFIYEVFGTKTKARLYVLIGSYVTGVALTLFYLAFPDTFLLQPVPKMYLPFYYVPGNLYWVMRLYFVFVSFFIFYDLIKVYLASNTIERNRVKYIFLGLLYGYTLGSTAVFLVYNIQIDPLYSMLFGLYTVPFFYTFLKYDLLDIQVFAKRALLYAATIVFTGFLIVTANTMEDIFVSLMPGLPFWFIPMLSSCVVVGVGGIVWMKIREVDKLKYEFVTVVTHKFRTPLTYITWSTDALKKDHTQADRDNAIQTIKTATSRLAELTDLLIGLEKTEESSYEYTFASENLQHVIDGCLEGEKSRIREKNIVLTKNMPPEDILVLVDKRRLEFALQIFIENAISYTPQNGSITITATKDKKFAILKITDTGIGIPKDEIQFLFTKFYRGKQARLVDTEGMGIGLYISRQIISKQGGTVDVHSEGAGKGTTFTVRLPLA